MEHYTESCEPLLTLTLTLPEYVRLHRGFAHYRNFLTRNSATLRDFEVLEEVTALQTALNTQVNAQLDARFVE